MRNVLYILLLSTYISCTNKQVTKPFVINKMDTLSLNNFHLSFITKNKNWTATLFTFNQPIDLVVKQNNDTLNVSYYSEKGFIEAPAKICLINNEVKFWFNCYLKNSTETTAYIKDYRSPKTVNPDSSLNHHKIIYSIDKWQNIQPINGNLFNEEEVSLGPNTLTENAIKNKNISAYYVQPGSCAKIILQYKKDSSNTNFSIQTNIMKDLYDNIIANGTKICFEYTLNGTVNKTFAASVNGIAQVKLPVTMAKHAVVKAYTHNTISNSIILN